MGLANRMQYIEYFLTNVSSDKRRGDLSPKSDIWRYTGLKLLYIFCIIVLYALSYPWSIKILLCTILYDRLKKSTRFEMYCGCISWKFYLPCFSQNAIDDGCDFILLQFLDQWEPKLWWKIRNSEHFPICRVCIYGMKILQTWTLKL